jgi:alpha-tubulin suppressor-like RCC1 family protein
VLGLLAANLVVACGKSKRHEPAHSVGGMGGSAGWGEAGQSGAPSDSGGMTAAAGALEAGSSGMTATSGGAPGVTGGSAAVPAGSVNEAGRAGSGGSAGNPTLDAGGQSASEGGAGDVGDSTPGPVQAIGVGDGFACALLTGGTVACWGRNDVGQLGVDSTDDSASPINLQGFDGPVSGIAVGYRHACAFTVSSAYCWGANDFGQLGDGTMDERHVPTAIHNISRDVAVVAAGGQNTCVTMFKTDPAHPPDVYCWGDNKYGQIGNGSTEQTYISPVTVISYTAGVSVGEDNTCALGGAVACAGWRFNPPGPTLVPLTVDGTQGASQVSVGSELMCIVSYGAAYCWGDNHLGSLGDGSNNNSATPVQVVGLDTGVSEISAGVGQACAIQQGRTWCWGGNSSGELGDGTGYARNTPRPVKRLPAGATHVATGPHQSCAVVNGHAYCWGQTDLAQSAVALAVPTL